MKLRMIILAFLGVLIPAAAEAAIAFVADGGFARASSSVSLTMPAGTVQNNLMVMCVVDRTNTAAGTITTPTGWTAGAITGGLSDGGPTYNNQYFFYKVAGASEAGPYTVSYNTGGTQVEIGGNIRTYSGTSTVTPINTTQTTVGATNSTTTIVGAFSETWVSGEWMVGCATSEDNTIPTTSPVLNNQMSNVGFQNSIIMGDTIPGSAPGAETYTYAGAVQGRPGWGVTIVPAAGGAASCNSGRLLMGAGC
jgi:hypothetical protein